MKYENILNTWNVGFCDSWFIQIVLGENHISNSMYVFWKWGHKWIAWTKLINIVEMQWLNDNSQ